MAGSVYNLVPTQKGRELIADVLAKSGTLQMTKMQLGSGYLPNGKTEAQMTTLSNAEVTLDITGVQPLAEETGFRVEALLTTNDITAPFFYRENGYFGKAVYEDGSSSAEILLTYGNAGDSAERLDPESAAISRRLVDRILLSGNVNVSMIISDGITATKEELDLAISTLNEEIAKKIPLGQKGIANGVATLDETGKVPPAQLPQLGMTAEEVQTLVAAGQDLIFTNVAVPAASWVATSDYTYAKFKATIELAGVSSAMDAEVFFSANDADSGMFSGAGVVNDGNITLLAIKQPTENITIPKIRFMKGASA